MIFVGGVIELTFSVLLVDRHRALEVAIVIGMELFFLCVHFLFFLLLDLGVCLANVDDGFRGCLNDTVL